MVISYRVIKTLIFIGSMLMLVGGNYTVWVLYTDFSYAKRALISLFFTIILVFLTMGLIKIMKLLTKHY
jgi:hypothetical protein